MMHMVKRSTSVEVRTDIPGVFLYCAEHGLIKPTSVDGSIRYYSHEHTRPEIPVTILTFGEKGNFEVTYSLNLTLPQSIAIHALGILWSYGKITLEQIAQRLEQLKPHTRLLWPRDERLLKYLEEASHQTQGVKTPGGEEKNG